MKHRDVVCAIVAIAITAVALFSVRLTTASGAIAGSCPLGKVRSTAQATPNATSCVWNCTDPGHYLNIRTQQCSPCKAGTFDPLG